MAYNKNRNEERNEYDRKKSSRQTKSRTKSKTQQDKARTDGSNRNDRSYTRTGEGNYSKNTKNVENLSTEGRDNDPNWYFTDANLADQVSSFSFDSYLGVPTSFQYSKIGASGANYTTGVVNTPSILAIALNPSPGNTTTIQTGINMASLKTYTMLSSINAKTTHYAPQDLTTLMLALGEVLSVVEHLRRCFGVAFTYNQRNRDLPVNLLKAMDMEPKTFLKNIATYRLQFNSWITAINKIPFLDNISYMYKCADLYQKVYLDSESSMGQIVFCKPYSTWQMNEKYSDQGTGLETVPLQNDTHVPEWVEWATIVDEMITALFESTTYNFIYSDILNYSTKQGAKLLYLDYLTEGYSVIPEYNRNFLLQMHNSNAIGAPLDKIGDVMHTPRNDVAPSVNTNTVSYNPIFNAKYICDQLIIDLDVPQANVVDRVEATRYQALLEQYTADSPHATGFALPDHYVVQYELFATSHKDKVVFVRSFADISALSTDKILSLYFLSQFDWAPIFYMFDGKGSPKDIVLQGDLNYFTTLPLQWYYRTNDIVFQSLFSLR